MVPEVGSSQSLMMDESDPFLDLSDQVQMQRIWTDYTPLLPPRAAFLAVVCLRDTADSPSSASVTLLTRRRLPPTCCHLLSKVAIAAAAKAKILLRELKTVKAELAFAKQ